MTTKIKEYGVREWITLGLGTIGFGIQAYRYATDSLGDYTTEVPIAGLCILLIVSPMTIVNLIRKAKGLETK